MSAKLNNFIKEIEEEGYKFYTKFPDLIIYSGPYKIYILIRQDFVTKEFSKFSFMCDIDNYELKSTFFKFKDFKKEEEIFYELVKQLDAMLSY